MLLISLLMLSPAQAGPTTETDHGLAGLFERLEFDSDERINFVETRQSDLLDEPLEVHGVLYRHEDRLVRETTAPREETHTLSARHVEIRNPAGHRQRFSLSRAPELGVLRQALLAVLERDHETLEQHFATELTCGRDGHWTLVLVPRDETMAKRVERLEMLGVDNRIKGLRMVLDDGEMIETRFKPDA